MMYSIEEIQKKVLSMCEKLGVSPEDEKMPMFSENPLDISDNEYVYVGKKYCYVICERGKEISRYESDEVDDVLYQVFRRISFSMAVEYELENRIEEQDSRRIIFNKQLDLLSAIDKKFCEKRSKEIDDILKRAPFHDKVM